MGETIYEREGYANREEYLRGLSADYGISYGTVLAIADVLGPNEDFDGLISELEDYAMLYGSDEEEE